MSDKDDLIVAGVNQKDKGIWRDFYARYYAALCSYVEKILILTDAVEDLVLMPWGGGGGGGGNPCGKVSVLFPTPVS